MYLVSSPLLYSLVLPLLKNFFLNYDYWLTFAIITLLFFLFIAAFYCLILVKKSSFFTKKISQKNSSLDSVLFLLSVGLEEVKQNVFCLESFLYIIPVIYFLIFIFLLKKGCQIYIKTNIIFLTAFCKQIQEFVKQYQTGLFFFTNLVQFLILGYFFGYFDIMIIQILWLDIFIFFWLCHELKIPILEVVAFYAFFLRILVFGVYSKLLVYFFLLLFYFACILDQFGVFDRLKDFISEILKDQLHLKTHKQEELTFFYIMEKQYVFFLIILFVCPLTATFSNLNFSHIFTANEQAMFSCFNVYIYSCIFVSMLVNIVVVYIFNPGTSITFKNGVACLSCIGVAATVTGVSLQHGENTWNQATGGVVEPNLNRAGVRYAQHCVFGAHVATAEGIRTAKIYKEIFKGPLPLYPGTTIADNSEMHRALLQDTSQYQKDRIALMQNRAPASPVVPPASPVVPPAPPGPSWWKWK